VFNERGTSCSEAATRSRVSFFMNKFRELGFIEYNGKLEVHNSLLNVVLHDNPQIRRGASTPP
jgi:CRP/FNR family transcriptional regulator, cyclic AMP receptor protein